MLYCSIKEGVLKEVLGIMVSYRIVVKLIVGGFVSQDTIYHYSPIKNHTSLMCVIPVVCHILIFSVFLLQ